MPKLYLIKYLLNESEEYKNIIVPESENERKLLLRGLFNVRNPRKANDEFYEIQDEYLKEEIRKKGITNYKDLRKRCLSR